MTLKIALVSAFPPSNGTLNEYGLHFAKELAQHKDVGQVVVLADEIPHGVEELQLDKIKVVRCWSFNQGGTIFRLLKALRAHKVDGVVFNLQTASFGDRELPAALGLCTPMLARWLGYRTGVLAHNLIEGIDLNNTLLKGNGLRQKIVKWGGGIVSYAMSRAHYLTTTLDLYADILKKRFPKANVLMVPHGTFKRDEIELLAFEQREKRIVTMGKFGTYKKLDLLLSAFCELAKKDKDLRLIIGGSDHPNAAGYMAALENEYACHSQIYFKGYIAEEQVPNFFARARVAVFDYSATTGSSGVLHQCASYGTVPVYPLIGDFIEMCEREGLRGVNYKVGDQATMMTAISRALYDEQQSNQLAASNLKAVDEMPLSEVVAIHMAQLTGEYN